MFRKFTLSLPLIVGLFLPTTGFIGPSHSAVAQRPEAPANAVFAVYYKEYNSRTHHWGKYYLYTSTSSYAKAVRVMNWLNSNPNVVAYLVSR